MIELEDNLSRAMQVRIFRNHGNCEEFCNRNKILPFAVILLWDEEDRIRVKEGKEPLCKYWKR